MKIAILTDTHLGHKNSSDIFLNYQERFFNEIFFPYCIENKITEILHLGDYYDNRKMLSIKALNSNRKCFLNRLRDLGMHMTIIPGNHDVFYRNTNEVTSLKETLGHFMGNVHLVLEPKVLEYDGFKIGALPWITIDNYTDSIKFIENCPTKILISHLELAGFEMMKGMPPATHGMDHSIFKKFDTVLSGHYHTKSNKDNIFYLGTPFEQTWADVDDPKFFHVLDTKSEKVAAIRNPLTIFNKIVYNDCNGPVKIPESITNNFVKIIVAHKKDLFSFDKFIDNLNLLNPYEIKISDTVEEFKADNVETEEDLNVVNDTSLLLNHYVDNVETELDKDRLKARLQELFVEAQNQD